MTANICEEFVSVIPLFTRCERGRRDRTDYTLNHSKTGAGVVRTVAQRRRQAPFSAGVPAGYSILKAATGSRRAVRHAGITQPPLHHRSMQAVSRQLAISCVLRLLLRGRAP